MLYRLCCLIALALAQASAQPAIPDTPAGRTFKAWLDAFNSGDRARLDAYYQKYEPAASVDGMMQFRSSTGGFELLAIEKSEPRRLEFRVKERNSATVGLGKMEVKNDDPGVIADFVIRAIPPGSGPASFAIDATTRPRVIEAAIVNLKEYYVFPEVADKMADALRTHEKQGDYDSITDGNTFANQLTKDLRAVSNDKHLGVNFSPVALPDGPPAPTPEAKAQMRKQMERMNCGFEKVEHLPGNIGYLKFNMFADTDMCAPTAIAAMNFLGNSDAIIFDLRENGGGQPKMVTYISSYLFAKPTHLNDLWERKGDKTTEFWTSADVSGKRLDDKPVFVLTSKRTFSGAEEFTYNLKNQKRATIVGETTGGGAHPVSGHRIDGHFMIGVPFARAINPVTKTNWEGTGVEPDVKVAAADALTTAQKLAQDKLRADARPPGR